jgi:hypothetical protein
VKAKRETGAMDFVHDQLAVRRKLQVLTIVDSPRRWLSREATNTSAFQ